MSAAGVICLLCVRAHIYNLLTFFEQDENTHIIMQHCEDLKDGRAFAEVAKRVSKKKPVASNVLFRRDGTSRRRSPSTAHSQGLHRLVKRGWLKFNHHSRHRARGL